MMKRAVTLKARALRYLSIREYSPKELARKLIPYADSQEEVHALLDWLQVCGFLSESRFVEAYIRRRASHYGNIRILRELEEHGVSDSTLEEAKAEMQETEFDRARSVWKKKFGIKPSDIKEKAKQIRFLQQRGFASGVIRRVLNHDGISE